MLALQIKTELAEKFPDKLMGQIALIMEMVESADFDVQLRFPGAYISPVFAIAILAMRTSLSKRNHLLTFNRSDLAADPEMLRFFHDSGLHEEMNEKSKRFVTQRLLASTLPLHHAHAVSAHTIDLSSNSSNSIPSMLIHESFQTLAVVHGCLPDELQPKLLSSLVELFDNAYTHSQCREEIYSMCVQLQNGDFLFSVYDRGIGIPGAYRAYCRQHAAPARTRNDPAIIRWALDTGHSTKQLEDGIPRGVGLFNLCQFAKQSSSILTICSGNGLYLYKDSQEQFQGMPTAMRGTMIMMIIPNK